MKNLLLIHYALVKGIYKYRWKDFASSVDALAFGCIFLFFLSLGLLLIDKELLWAIVGKRLPLGPMVKGILTLLSPLLVFLFSSLLLKSKIETNRKVILLKNRIKRKYSILYVGFYVVLFFSVFFYVLVTKP